MLTNNQLPAMSIRGIILEFKSKLFWISLPEALTQVIKVELRCDIWLTFALVTVPKLCSLYGNVSGLCHCAIAQRKIAGSIPLLSVQI